MTGAESKYDLAIILLVRNEEKYLAQTLDQIYLQDFPMDRLEIVIADSGSGGQIRQITESFRNRFGSLKVLDNPRRVPSAGRNIGVKNSTAPYVLMMDGPTYIPSKDFLARVVATFEETGADCLCRPRPLRPPDISEFQLAVAICRGSFLGHKPGSEIYSDFEGEVDPVSSGAMYQRDVFDKIGYFDEDFDACDDVDFNYRLKKAGCKSYLSPGLKLLYYPRSTIQELWRQMNRLGVGRFRFTQKHNILAPVQWFAGAAVLGFAAVLLLSFFSAAVSQWFRTMVALYLLIVILLSAYLAFKEKHPGCLLLGPLIFPTIHFGLGVGFLRAIFDKLKGN